MAKDISNALLKCQKYARTGYEMADNGYDAIMETLEKERKWVEDTERQQKRLKRGEWSNADVLRRQRRGLKKFSGEVERLQKDLAQLHKDQKEFTVLVFGRTEVGKSTLMEVLTHGDGKSIGQGGQRTTRDIREYHWNGLKVIDVPGIAAFKGKEDEDVAFEAVPSADLVMFLISDDGVQAEEAKHLARLLSMGKPVLGLINIKVGFDGEPRPVDLKRIAKKMGESERIDAICDQFRAYAASYEQDWSYLTFVRTHLKAAFVGQDKNEKLWNLSNFEAVEEYLLEKVEKDGAFLRIKTFVDNVAAPMQKRLADIVSGSSENLKIGLEYREKCNGMYEWRKTFIEKTENKFAAFMGRLRKKVDSAIYDFAEHNHANKYAGDAWKIYLKENVDIEKECSDFIHEIGGEFKKKQRELADDMRSDLRYSGIEFSTSDIAGEEVWDTQGMAQLGITAAFLLEAISGPVGIALAFGAWLIGDSKEEKIRKRKKEMREKLGEAMSKVMDDVGDAVLKVINDKILHEGVDGLIADINKRDDIMINLADEEYSMARDVRAALCDLNLKLWEKADAYLGLTAEGDNFYDIARIPGQCSYAFGSKKYTDNELQAFSRLLVGKFTYKQISKKDEEDIEPLYWWETAQALFEGNIGREEISYGDDESLVVYNIPEYDLEELQQKWEYAIIQQLDPMPILL